MARSLLCARAVALISCSQAPTQVRLTAHVPAPHPEASCSGAQLPAPSASSFPVPSPCFSLLARSASEVPPMSTCSQCLWFRLQFGAWSSLSVLSAERFSCARAAPARSPWWPRCLSACWNFLVRELLPSVPVAVSKIDSKLQCAQLLLPLPVASIFLGSFQLGSLRAELFP
jgi:hypothetical protein